MLRKHEIRLFHLVQKNINKNIESVRDGTVGLYFKALSSLRHYLLNFGLSIILQVEIVLSFL